jgi:hypothetical protein
MLECKNNYLLVLERKYYSHEFLLQIFVPQAHGYVHVWRSACNLQAIASSEYLR